MSNADPTYTDDKLGPEIPEGAEVNDKSYISRPGTKNEPIQVVNDNERIEQPSPSGDADSNEQLKKDDAEAIDKSNIIEGRTRHSDPDGRYTE